MSGLKPLRGELWRLTESAAARIGVPKNRRWLIVQNNDFQIYGSRVAALITSIQDDEGRFKFQIKLEANDAVVLVAPDKENGLRTESFVVCIDLYTIQQQEFSRRLGRFSVDDMKAVDKALAISLNLKPPLP